MSKHHESHAYLTFSLGEEKFAVSVENVQEVVELEQVTKVPNAPAYMLGIINLRGKVLPLLDTRLKLGLSETKRTSKSRVLILDIQSDDDKNLQIGATVDVAREVIEISSSEIQETPGLEDHRATAPIIGVVNNRGDITMVMDINKVFKLNEIIELHTSTLNRNNPPC